MGNILSWSPQRVECSLMNDKSAGNKLNKLESFICRVLIFFLRMLNRRIKHFKCITYWLKICKVCCLLASIIVLDRKHSCRHIALSEISNRIVGKILLRTIWCHAFFFLLMWGLQMLLFGLQDSLVWRRSTECQLYENNEHPYLGNTCSTISCRLCICYC